MAATFTRRDALTLLGGAVATLAGCRRARQNTIVAGSKNFTEQIILAELLAQQIEAHTALRVDRRLNLGGTLICHRAMLAGQMDFYVEYTGTALTAVLGEPSSNDTEAVYSKVRDAYRDRFGFEVGPPLGFNNTFAIVVRSEDAQRLKLRTISWNAPTDIQA
jgi:glycine betaine/choline ABC-type transport system substrate-binding protein